MLPITVRVASTNVADQVNVTASIKDDAQLQAVRQCLGVPREDLDH